MNDATELLFIMALVAVFGSVMLLASAGVGNDSNLNITTEQVSPQNSTVGFGTEPFVRIESSSDDRLVFVGRAVSYSGVVDGFDIDVRTEGSTIYVSPQFVKPDKPPTAPRAAVVNTQNYRVTVENADQYDTIVIRGREFDISDGLASVSEIENNRNQNESFELSE